MKCLQRVTPFISLAMVFALSLIILPIYWPSKNEALFFITGFWLIGEATSRIERPFPKVSSDSIFKNYFQSFTIARISVGLGGLIMIGALFLPWFQTAQPLYGVTSNSGYSTDGLQIGIAGLVPLVVAIFRKGILGKPYSIFCTLWGICVLSFLMDTYASLGTSVFIFRELGAKLAFGSRISLFGIVLVIIGGIMSIYANEK